MSLLCLMLFAGCGGGGGGSIGGGVIVSTPPATASSFETDEFLRQEGLALINASSMYAAGGTGANVKVGVADSGINAVETNAAGLSTNDRLPNLDGLRVIRMVMEHTLQGSLPHLKIIREYMASPSMQSSLTIKLWIMRELLPQQMRIYLKC